MEALICSGSRLTQVEEHAGEDDESEPDAEVGDKVDDGDDNVTDGGKDAEQDVAGGGRTQQQKNHIITRPGSTPAGTMTPPPPAPRPHLSRLLMEEVPRSTLLSTSPVRLSRCQRSDRPCRWENKHT